MLRIAGTLTTYHKNPGCVAESLKADNLMSMTTEATGDCVVCRIKGDKLRSVVASTDDYLMNLSVADDICDCISKSSDI
ncbi:MAG: KEOPS complex subunit Pcc1 [Methanomicrobium sp.]|nr:KEOPS complex subunit Pcc1 [Methanomicrobium sp.]MDD4299919.1 KEOPS complex subunit Pcc1 [Methanomicrobium sp.]